MKVSVITFGCTVNNFESQEIMRRFAGKGDEIVERAEPDVIIVNSCVVTGAAEKGALQLIDRQRRKFPGALIILTGCYNEYAKKGLAGAAPGPDVVMLDKKRPDFVDEARRLHHMKFTGGAVGCDDRGARISPGPRQTPKPDSIPYSDDTLDMIQDNAPGNALYPDAAGAFRPARAIVRIQNGCSHGCSFCVVPQVRGRSVSTPFYEIENKINELAGEGYRNFVLAGMNPGSYYNDGMPLIGVLDKIEAMPGVNNIWLSSLEPMNIGDPFINGLPRIKKLCPHLHISLQSGCDRTLSRMGRQYGFIDYLDVIEKIRGKAPGIAITTDIIVGFPGESERDFENSIENIVKCRFCDIHIFKYSPRRGTAAAGMGGQVTEHRKNARAQLLKGVKMQARYNFYSKFIGADADVAILRKSVTNKDAVDTGGPGIIWEGLTGHGFPVFIPGGAPEIPTDQMQALLPVRITGMNASQDAYTGAFI